MKILLVILVVVLTPAISSSAELDKTGLLLEGVWQTLHIADWGQTLDVARNPYDYHEINPIMGRHPSVGNVNIYMGMSALVHAGISYALPKKYRTYWQSISIVVTGALVVHNNSIGLEVRF
jgi:hypothetical protein